MRRFTIALSLALTAVLAFGATFPVVTVEDSTDKGVVYDEPTVTESPQERRDRADRIYHELRGPTYPAPSGDGTEVIYGTDDREDIYTISDPAILQVAQATCVVVDVSEISNNGNGTYTLSTSAWTTQGGLPLCAGERFVGQLQIGFCTGFLIGDSILATAGHCVSNADCGATAFVFGFQQINATTPPNTVVPAANVYFCDGIIDRKLAGNQDHCIIRLDRMVVGRTPLPIRRSGVVSNADPIFVVGHPTVLPLKSADNAEVKNATPSQYYFQANLDTYGGNSGSPVWGVNSSRVEGILVRGAPDFDQVGGCMQSNVVPNSGNPGPGLMFEEVSKTITFASFVPELVTSQGRIALDRSSYSCSGVVNVEMRDLDLAGSGSHNVDLTTTGGDSELLTLTETSPGSGIFTGSIPRTSGGAIPSSGSLELAHNETVTATYQDADDGTGNPATATDSATTDCVGPVIMNVNVSSTGGHWAMLAFDTDEPGTSVVRYGPCCADLLQSRATAGQVTSHLVTVGGLSPSKQYYYVVEVTDAGGNTTIDDNGGACFTFSTTSQSDYFTELFDASDNDLDNKTITFTPDGSPDFYSACVIPAPSFPTDPAGGTPLSLGDEASVQVNLSGGAKVKLYGVEYPSFYVISNGYVTFGGSSIAYQESFASHFSTRPRVSGLFDDLDPSAGGTVYAKQLADRAVVTYKNIPEWTVGDSNNVQIEMFFDGRIAITCLRIDASDGLAGLSRGAGLPGDFVESDLSQYICPACSDFDCDVICDLVDNCPGTPNPLQEDGDADSIGDACDNCPYFNNADQTGCLHHGDPEPDSVINVQDVVRTVDVAFRGIAPTFESGCPHNPGGRSDMDCSGATDVVDVVLIVDAAFRGLPANFCNPCDCNPYPTGCP